MKEKKTMDTYFTKELSWCHKWGSDMNWFRRFKSLFGGYGGGVSPALRQHHTIFSLSALMRKTISRVRVSARPSPALELYSLAERMTCSSRVSLTTNSRKEEKLNKN